MNREDCEKLLAAYRESVIAGNGQAAQPLFEVIVNIMADGKKPAYRGGGIASPGTILWDGDNATVPVHVTKPVVTCDGRITARTATWDNSEGE